MNPLYHPQKEYELFTFQFGQNEGYIGGLIKGTGRGYWGFDFKFGLESDVIEAIEYLKKRKLFFSDPRQSEPIRVALAPPRYDNTRYSWWSIIENKRKLMDFKAY